MQNEEFQAILKERLSRTERVLGMKAEEYAADDDRLHNFKVSAALAGTLPAQECWGFTRKHLVSITDMVNGIARGKSYAMPQWEEKIGDAINYLILLEAIVKEQG